MWFLTQLVRLGFAGEDIDYRQVANAVTQTGLYREVANAMGVPLPENVDRSVRLLGGDVWDARDVDGALPAAR
jgi:nitrate/nitrite transport system substrate-binding protein